MDIKLFQKLLEEEKFEQAVELLKDYLHQPLTEAELGGLYVAYTMAYLKVTNEAKTEYFAQLKDINSLLKDLDKTQAKMDDLTNLGQIRKQLGSN